MGVFNIREAKAQLADLVDAACNGEDIVISKAGQPVARLVSVATAHGNPVARKPGSLKGKIHIADDFDAPLPPEILSGFNGD
jgi:prevent-host-death family protein